MSRYNQFTGFAGKLNVKGTDTVEGRMVYNAANPIILSWVARCRLQAKESGLQVVTKHLNTDILRAHWTWQFGAEILDIEIFSVPTTQERVEAMQPKPEFAEPIENKSEVEPILDEPLVPLIKIEEIQIENDLPPLPPQLIKTLVLLTDDKYCTVYDMRSLEKGLDTQKPLIEKFETQGDWTLPDETRIPRLRDYYFGGMNFDRFQGGRLREPWHYSLQMTNDTDMGPVAIAGVSFSGGVFSYSQNYVLYRLKAGLKSNATLEALHNVGQIGCAGSFPALMATSNMIYACTETFTLSPSGVEPDITFTLEKYGALDGYTYGDWIENDFGTPFSIPVVPNFIDSTGEPCYEVNSNVGVVSHPSTGADLWRQNYPDTVWGRTASFTSPVGGPYSGAGVLAKPAFTQENGVDVIRTEDIDTSWYSTGASNDLVTVGSYSSARTGSWAHIHFVSLISVPYPPPNDFTFYGAGDDAEITSFLGPSQSGYIIPTNSNPGSSYEVYTGSLQVSNGVHNLQGFVFHSTTWSGSGFDAKFPRAGGECYFFLDGQDFTTTLETACETTADKIQYAFMDVPLFSAQTIKKAT